MVFVFSIPLLADDDVMQNASLVMLPLPCHAELVSASFGWFFRSRNKFGMTFGSFGMTEEIVQR
jgi:hypothetical protein